MKSVDEGIGAAAGGGVAGGGVVEGGVVGGGATWADASEGATTSATERPSTMVGRCRRTAGLLSVRAYRDGSRIVALFEIVAAVPFDCGRAYAIQRALPLRIERLRWRLTRIVVRLPQRIRVAFHHVMAIHAERADDVSIRRVCSWGRSAAFDRYA